MTTLTPEKREEIRKRAEAAAPEKRAGSQRAEVLLTWAEQKLLDHAREDIPALLSALDAAIERAEKAEAENEKLRSIVETAKLDHEAAKDSAEAALLLMDTFAEDHPRRVEVSMQRDLINIRLAEIDAALKEKTDGQG